MKVKNNIEFQEAIAQREPVIELMDSISLVNTVQLAKGQKIITHKRDIFLGFIDGDGIGLSGDNEIANIALQTAPGNRAIYIT